MNSFTFGSIANYECNNGFVLVGDLRRTCQDNGLWSGSEPQCIGWTIVLYFCKDLSFCDCRLYQAKLYTSLETERLSLIMFLPLSLIVPPPGCGDPGTPRNGRRLGNNFTVGAVVFFRCFDDFDIVGSKFRICQANGSWSGTQPVCQPFNSEYIHRPNSGLLSKSHKYRTFRSIDLHQL